MMTSRTNAIRSRLDTLEARDVPARFGTELDFGDIAWESSGGVLATEGIVFDPSGGVFDPTQAASITFTDGIVTAVGTDSADVVRFEFDDLIASPLLFPGTDGGLHNRARVTITDAAGVVRLDASGNPLSRYFPVADVRQFKAVTLGGHDRVVNTTGVPMYAEGGDGDDSVQGGDAKDTLYGGNGNDSLNGGNGNDQLYGEAGYDVLVGGGGFDVCFYGDGSDGYWWNGEYAMDVTGIELVSAGE